MTALMASQSASFSSKYAAKKRPRRLDADVKDEFLKPRATDHQDLPPISRIRDALVRSAIGKKTSSGISYSLPVHKGRLSIANVYQTDLRCLFQQPYLDCNFTKCNGFDDIHHLELGRCHLQPNSLHTMDRTHVRKILSQHQDNRVCLQEVANSLQLDVPSRLAIRTYLHSAPANSTLLNGLRCRSRFSLPVALNVTEASCEARRLAQNILRSLNIDANVMVDDEEKTNHVAPSNDGLKSTVDVTPNELPIRVHKQALPTLPLRQANLHSFEQFKESVEERYRPSLPATIQFDSKLTETQSQRVWQWLTARDEVDKFTYFLSLCQ